MYRRDADRQVQQIIRERAQQTLDYTPKTDIDPTPEVRPAPQAFRKIPTTPIAPKEAPAIQRLRRVPAAAPMGPEEGFAVDMPRPVSDELGASLAVRRASDRFRLGPPEETDTGATTFELFSALKYAIENSRTYRTRLEDLYLVGLDVTLERHLFTPRPFARTTVAYTGGQLDADYRSAYTVTQTAGVRQQLPYGGEIVADGLVRFIQAINDNSQSGEEASLALRGSIPLLRGAGMVNLEPLIDSERQLVYEVRQFEEFRRSFVVDIASAYFDLVNSQNRINNSLIRYVNAMNLVARLEDLYAAGLQNFLQVQQARQQFLEAENQLITSQQQYENQLDDFKLLIGMPIDQPLQVVGVALDVPIPDIQRIDFVDLAYRYRLALQTARDQIEDATRRVAVARNGLLPDLTLDLSAQIGNRDGTPAKAIDSRDLTYTGGMTLDLPVDQLQERNAYRASLIGFERSQRNLITAQDTVAADVRTAARAVESSLITLQIQRRSIDLARRRLDYANELLIQGLAQARDVTDAQNALLNAQNSFDSARATLQIQILRLLRDTGTLRVDPSAGDLGTVMEGPNSPYFSNLVDAAALPDGG